VKKQYHLRASERGLLAWDVRRLAELAKDLPREQIELTAIQELDELFWAGYSNTPTGLSVEDHAKLIEKADLRFPIILSADGRVMDGMHRVAKATLMGQLTIEAVRFASDPEPDFVGYGPDELPV